MPVSPASPSPPVHVAIIMDGNGRWATARRLPRQAGHRAGIDAVRRTVRLASDKGLKVLTLYSFSSENWRRPVAEVSYLMDLFRFFFRREINDLHAHRVRVRFIGERAELDADILKLMTDAEAKTDGNDGLQLNVAINYGSRREMTRAAERILAAAAEHGAATDTINEAAVGAALYDPDMPDPELIIRTGGDQRLSNFLLWQGWRAQLYYTPIFWPDFKEADFDAALAWLADRAAVSRHPAG